MKQELREAKRSVGALRGELLLREADFKAMTQKREAEKRSAVARSVQSTVNAAKSKDAHSRAEEELVEALRSARTAHAEMVSARSAARKAGLDLKKETNRAQQVESELNVLAELYQKALHLAQETEEEQGAPSTPLPNAVEAKRLERLSALEAETLPAYLHGRPLPARKFTGDAESKSAEAQYRKKAVAHMSHVLGGRGDGTNIEHIAAAVATADKSYPSRLMATPQFTGLNRELSKSVVDAVQSHWTALLGVHIWDRLDLSRSQYDTLRHLLSYVYDPETDSYVPIKVWINPVDASDFVLAARLPGRHAREKKFGELADSQEIIVGANGRCQRDVGKAICDMYVNNAPALRNNYSTARPAQPVLYLDGTGSSIGRGLGHAEIGSADFKLGVKQSRRTLAPVAAWEGNDHRPDQEENLDIVIPSFNKAVANGTIRRAEDSIVSRPITVADMQGTKSTYGMNLTSHSVWCTCGEEQQHKYPDKAMESYEEMLAYIESIGCKIKTERQMCEWAHFPFALHRGGRFERFKCACGYAPTEQQWHSDLSTFNALSDEDQKAERLKHMQDRRHHYQDLFTPPLPHLGMERAGVDDLHLDYLNIFKHLFKYTIHEGLPESNKKAVAAYLRDQHFYSYNALGDEESDPCSGWIGREVKRFIYEACTHLPVLLRLAHAPPDVIDELTETVNGLLSPSLGCARPGLNPNPLTPHDRR